MKAALVLAVLIASLALAIVPDAHLAPFVVAWNVAAAAWFLATVFRLRKPLSLPIRERMRARAAGAPGLFDSMDWAASVAIMVVLCVGPIGH